MSKKEFLKKYIRELVNEVEEELEESTATGAVDGYQTPHAFSAKKHTERRKKTATQAGYDIVDGDVENITEGKIPQPIQNLIDDMVKNKIQARIVTIKNPEGHKRFMVDVKPAIDAKLLMVKHNPIDKDKMTISLGPKAQDLMYGESVTEDEVSGGKADDMTLQDIADKHGVSLEQIADEFKKGYKVEREHTDDTDLAKEIAMDHLVEMPDYYTKLAKMEKESVLNEAENWGRFAPAKERVYLYVKNGKRGDLDLVDLREVPEGLQLLTQVGGNLYINDTKIKEIPNLKTVNGNLVAHNSKLEKLPKGLVVKGILNIQGTPLAKKMSMDAIKQIVKAERYLVESVNEMEEPNFIPQIGTIDTFRLKSMLQKNSDVTSKLGKAESDLLNSKKSVVIGNAEGKPFNFIVTDGNQEFTFDGKKKRLVKGVSKARPEIKNHFNESVNETFDISKSDLVKIQKMDVWAKKYGLQKAKNPKQKASKVYSGYGKSNVDIIEFYFNPKDPLTHVAVLSWNDDPEPEVSFAIHDKATGSMGSGNGDSLDEWKWGKTWREYFEGLNEGRKPKKPVNRWLELKNDETQPNKKLAVGLKELKYKLSEIEKFLSWYNKISKMNELSSDSYWKRTHRHIYKIKERIINIAQTIKELEQ